jgi:hypothetical protein
MAACLSTSLLALGAIGWSVQSWTSARESRAAAETELAEIVQRTQELRAIGLHHPQSSTAKQGSLTTRISEAAAAAHIQRASIASIVPAPELLTTVAGTDARAVQRRVAIEFTGISLPRLGAFLHEWNTREPAWRSTAIDLRPSAHPVSGSNDERPLLVSLVLESISIEGESR